MRSHLIFGGITKKRERLEEERIEAERNGIKLWETVNQ